MNYILYVLQFIVAYASCLKKTRPECSRPRIETRKFVSFAKFFCEFFKKQHQRIRTVILSNFRLCFPEHFKFQKTLPSCFDRVFEVSRLYHW